MTKFAPFHVLVTREPVTHTTKSGKEITDYRSGKQVKVQVFQSLTLALREHAIACQQGRGIMLHIEPPFDDLLSWDDTQ